MTSGEWFNIATICEPAQLHTDKINNRRQAFNKRLRWRYDLELSGDKWFEVPTIVWTMIAIIILAAPEWQFLRPAVTYWWTIPQWFQHITFLPEYVWSVLLILPTVGMIVGKVFNQNCVRRYSAFFLGAFWWVITMAVYGSGVLSLALALAPNMTYNCVVLYLCYSFKCKTEDAAKMQTPYEYVHGISREDKPKT